MSDDVGRAEKIALARKKLKNFEVQRANCPSESRSSLNTADGRHSSLSVSSQQDSNSLHSFMVVNDNNLKKDSDVSLSTDDAYNGMAQGSSSPFLKSVVDERNEAIKAYENSKQQLEELQAHYSQLHAAYSQIASNGMHSEAQKQVIQLQAALTMVIEEKASIQLKLREFREKLDRSQIAPSMENVEIDDSALRELRKELEARDRLLVARGVELEVQRTGAAEARATLLTVQHERSEAKARLKAVFRERDALETELKTLRKEVNMKDIHLKQMSSHQTAHIPVHTNSDEVNAELSSLRTEVAALRDQKNEMQIDFESSKKRFDVYSNDLRQNLLDTENKLEQVLSENFTCKESILELEEQLRASRETTEVACAQPVLPRENREKEYDVLNNAMRRLKQRLQETVLEHEAIVLDKDKMLFEREQTLSETLIRCRHLEDRISEIPAVSPDLVSLSEQLQNEKSTVSRAVTQNKELKEQLVETQDRLVVLTEEKLQSELARQHAEHQVKELNRRISLLEAGLVSPHPPSTLEEVKHPSVNLAPVVQERIEDDYFSHTCRESELEQEIVSVREQLSAVVGQLRRSEHRNEEINQMLMLNAQDENQNSFHVELGQAVNRVQQLNSDNEELRNTVAELQSERSDLLSKIECLENIDDEPMDQTETIITNESSHVNNIGSKEWAKYELEKRFEQVIRQNAELMENMDKLEHVNVQLQLENDTIADHVVLYQHQRRLIRERLKVKDQQLASLETERIRVSERCAELQEALLSFIDGNKASSSKETPDNFARRVSRTYSHSTIDELSGDEDVVVSSTDELPLNQRDIDVEDIQPPQENGIVDFGHKNIAVQKILNLIEDIRMPVSNTSSEQLHCTQCIGDLKTL